MFGEGGPGAIYRLDAPNGYKPRLFATVTLNGRQNSGAALGNIAYDRWNKQFLVSDLETGMIHRIGLDGRDIGSFDHGTQGRTSFVDAQTGQSQSLKPIAFNPSSQAKHRELRRPLRCHDGLLEHRRVEPPRVGPRRVERPERRNPPVLLGGEQPGPRRFATGTACRTTRSATRSGRCGSAPDGSFDPSGVRREVRAAGLLRQPAGRRPRRATAGRSPTSPSRPARAVRSCWSPSAAACAISASARKTHSPPRMRRAPSATSSTRAARGVRSAATTSACTTARRRARPTSTRTAPAASPSARATGRWPRNRCSRRLRLDLRRQAVLARRPLQPGRRSADGGGAGAAGQHARRRTAVPARRHGSARRARPAAGHVQPARPGDRQRPEPAGAGQPIGPDQAYMVDFDINVDAAGNIIPTRSPRTTRP